MRRGYVTRMKKDVQEIGVPEELETRGRDYVELGLVLGAAFAIALAFLVYDWMVN